MHEYAPSAITIAAIFAGVLFNRNDVTNLRAEIKNVKTDLRSDIASFRAEVNARLVKIQDDLNGFHRSLGQHDEAIDTLKKSR